MTAPCELVGVSTPAQWNAFHKIRETILFEARGRFGVYDRNHPDDFNPENQPFLLLRSDQPVGVARLDRLGETRGGIRLVAIDAPMQRQGYGRILMAMVEACALNAGLVRLELNSAPEAVTFYQHLGWQLVDAEREHPLLEKVLVC